MKKNEITVFESPDFGEIRTLNINREPWCVLKDICRVLNILNLKDLVKT